MESSNQNITIYFRTKSQNYIAYISKKVVSNSAGLEEELAEAVNKEFYEFYKRRTLDNPGATSSQKVGVQETKSSKF